MQLFEKLIEYPEAERLVLESTPLLPVEETPLGEALGLALAQDLTATTDSPPPSPCAGPQSPTRSPHSRSTSLPTRAATARARSSSSTAG